jgi:hypothetical protein
MRLYDRAALSCAILKEQTMLLYLGRKENSNGNAAGELNQTLATMAGRGTER